MGCGSSKTTATSNTNNEPANINQEELQDIEDGDDNVISDEKQPIEDKEQKEENEPQSTEWSKFELESLKSHNNYRDKHSASPLILNRNLCDIAQSWANHLAENKLFEHSKPNDREYNNDRTGENLYLAASTGEVVPDGESPVDSWYSEIKDYNFDSGEFSLATGHFTQVVWAETQEMGIAYQVYEDGEWQKIVVVANYFPAGNLLDNFIVNVKPAKE